MRGISVNNSIYAGTSYCLTFKECVKTLAIHSKMEGESIRVSDGFRIVNIGHSVKRSYERN